MKYTAEIEIDLPLEKVVALFDNAENMKKWMKGLVSFEPISFNQGQVGSKAKLVFKMNNRVIEMIETITVKNLPNEFSGTYEAKGVFNIVKNRFVALGFNRTRYITENEFQFSGAMMKLMGWLMPGAFRKQSMKYLKDFKAFCESHKE